MTDIDPDVIPEVLRPVWKQRREVILTRIAQLESALRETDGVDVAVGRVEAHKLRGLLGTFGFAQGTTLSGAAEGLLLEDDPARPGWSELADLLDDFRQSLPTS